MDETDQAAKTAMFDADARIEKMIWAPAIGSVSSGAYSDDFTDFCEDVLADDGSTTMHKSFAGLTVFKQVGEDPDIEMDDAIEAIALFLGEQEISGFFVQAATPVYKYRTPTDTQCAFSWGRYHTCWIYIPRVEDLASTLAAWANEKHEADRLSSPAKAA